jgi:preprotein translocase subunit SecD
MGKYRVWLGVIFALTIAAVVVIIQVPTQLGLDLRGGSQLTHSGAAHRGHSLILLSEKWKPCRPWSQGRVNGLGVSEAVVQQLGNDQLLVQLPGVSDPQQAERVLGGTAQLEFRAQKPGTERQLPIENQVLQEHLAELARLQAQIPEGGLIDPATQERIEAVQKDIAESEAAIADLFEPPALPEKSSPMPWPAHLPVQAWEVVIQFNAEGGHLLPNSPAIAGTGRSIGIFLDNRLLSAPTVNVQYAETGITGGSAVISGQLYCRICPGFRNSAARGGLPLPVEVVENRTVGPTLGETAFSAACMPPWGV